MRRQLTECPNCGTDRATSERFCPWCLEDYEKYTGCCTECGQPKDLTIRVAEFIRRARRE